MKYRLILQWPASSIKDYDSIIEIEDMLIEKLSEGHEVDGHDAGSGEINIFILTENPRRAFDETKAIFGTQDFWTDARVAFNEVGKAQYTILWPTHLTKFKVA